MTSLEELCRIDCRLAFRVEGDFRDLESHHRTLCDGDMIPRGQHLTNGSWAATIDAHLSWGAVPTPLISLFSSWRRALDKRAWLIEKGAQDVVIIAVWLGGRENVYSAWEAARRLGYDNSTGSRRQLRYHYAEVIVWGTIESHEHRFLACFYGDEPLIRIALEPIEGAGLMNTEIPNGSFPVPESSLPIRAGADMTRELKLEMYSLTGAVNRAQFSVLVRMLCRPFLRAM